MTLHTFLSALPAMRSLSLCSLFEASLSFFVVGCVAYYGQFFERLRELRTNLCRALSLKRLRKMGRPTSLRLIFKNRVTWSVSFAVFEARGFYVTIGSIEYGSLIAHIKKVSDLSPLFSKLKNKGGLLWSDAAKRQTIKA